MKKFHHDHSWYFDNTLRQIIIYDKARQLKEKKSVSLDKHIMRIEYRLKKKQKITSSYHPHSPSFTFISEQTDRPSGPTDRPTEPTEYDG